MASITSRARQLVSALAVVVLLALTLVSSSSALEQTAAAPIERYRLPSYGVSFDVPASWNAKDYRDPSLHQQFGGALGPTVKFAAWNPKRQQDFLTTFVVGVVPAGAGMTLREHASREVVPYRLDPTARIVGSANDYVQLPGGRAWRLRVRFVGAANGGGTVYQLQYHMLRSGRFYVFSYVTLQTLESKYAATFDESARSIRFGGA
jgi:hypothetical protein